MYSHRRQNLSGRAGGRVTVPRQQILLEPREGLRASRRRVLKATATTGAVGAVIGPRAAVFGNHQRRRMVAKPVNGRARSRLRTVMVSAAALVGIGVAMPVHGADTNPAAHRLRTATPIRHVIVVIGENRSFDHVYGAYVPKSGNSILNLLSEGIVRRDGSPGPNFAKAKQFTTSGQTSYFIGVSTHNKTPYTTLPAPTLDSNAENRRPEESSNSGKDQAARRSTTC